MVQYMRDPIGCFQPSVKRYGDPVVLPSSPPTLFTGDPAGIKAIYTAPPEILEPQAQDTAFLLGSSSLILASGDRHRRLRRLLNPPFLGSRVRAHAGSIHDTVERRLIDWTPGSTRSAVQAGQAIALDVILRAVFGVEDQAAQRALGAAVLGTLSSVSPLLLFFPWLKRPLWGMGPFDRVVRQRAALDAELDVLIAGARARGPGADVLSLLLGAKVEDEQPLTDAEIRDQLLLLVVAGHETTGLTLAWALYALHRPEHAAALERARAAVAGLSPEQLVDEPYLEAVCQETLRRFPLAPAPAPRRLLAPFELLGLKLDPGVGVCAAPGIAHFREDLYPDPWTWRPERFLERTYSPFEFIPFGGGARRCLGASLAMTELKIGLGWVLQHLRLRLADLTPDPGKVRAANSGPRSGVDLVVEERLA